MMKFGISTALGAIVGAVASSTWWATRTDVAIVVSQPSLDATIAGLAIIFSSLFAIGVPLLLRQLDARDARQESLDAAFDVGRWAYAIVAGGVAGLGDARLSGGLRVQYAMAHHRLSAINLMALRSLTISRRVRQVQRLAQGLSDVIPDQGIIDPGAQQTVERFASQLSKDIASLARLVERRPALTDEEIVRRLDVT